MRKINNIETIYEAKAPYRRYCKCGHTVTILTKNKRTICRHCGNYVFLEKQDEFKYRLLNSLKRKELI